MAMTFAGRFVLLAVLGGVPGVQAQSGTAQGAPAPSVTAANSSAEPMAPEQLMTSTVHEAWLKSGRNEDKFFDMVKQLAEVSAQKRGVTLPDTEAAGRRLGMRIRTGARRDPDQLLYAVVDSAVKQVAGGTAAAGK